MVVFFNPNNESFTSDKKSKIYIDKGRCISCINLQRIV